MTTAARRSFMLCLTAVLFGSLAAAQSTSSAQSSAVVPRLVNYSGKATEAGKVITGVAGATFAIYSEESGGSPLWLETQNIQADAKGNYTVQLGATKPDGLPLDLFTSGEARWLGVTINSGQEQPRVLLLSVPYALKAADSETVGGLPASAFMLAAPPIANPANATGGSEPASVTSATSSDVTTTGGTADTIPLFTTSTNIQNSLLTQTGTTAINVVGKLNLPATGTATASAGFNSRPQDFVASVYDSTSKAAVPQTFQWQAEPVGNDTSAVSGSLHLLYGSGTTTPVETGLKISNKGLITFASGQTLPSVSGNETVTGDLTAGELISTVATGTAPLKVTSSTEVPNLNASLLGGKAASAFAQLGAANTFTGNNTFNIGADFLASGDTPAIGAASSRPGYTAVVVQQTATSSGSTGMLATTNDSSGFGVSGVNFGTSGTPTGVFGSSSGSGGYGVEGQGGTGVYGLGLGSGGYGVHGYGDSAGVYGVTQTATGYGVAGDNNAESGSEPWGIGVYGHGNIGTYGVYGSPSLVGADFNSGTVGIWGDSGVQNQHSTGVEGTSDNGIGGFFINNSPNSQNYTTPSLLALNIATESQAFAAVAFMAGAPGSELSGPVVCMIDVDGNLTCPGTTSAVVPADGGSRKVALYAVEAPENWFEDFGSGQLSNGSARIDLEPTFAQTVNTGLDYHVFLTPRGECEGLYVTNLTPSGFEVRELHRGSSSVAFDYRIIAKRRNYETIRLADLTEPSKKFEEQSPRIRQRKPAAIPAAANSAAALGQKPGIVSGQPIEEKPAQPAQSAVPLRTSTK